MEHTPITIDTFGGLYRRGYDGIASSSKFNEECPQDHFCDSLNTQFFGPFVGTRFGAHKDTTISNIKRTQIYRRVGEADRTLILTYSAGVGKIYDSTNLAAAILTITGMSDFSSCTIYNRAFISPHNGVTGLAGEKVYIYDGTTVRAACGVAPVGVLTLATSASAGSIEVGTHLISVAYETDSGFITPMVTPVAYVAPGGFKLDISNIPLGPAYVTARWLIATQVITYNGNPTGFATFFIPNGRIGDNTTTSLTVDFFDVQLASSADALFDELDEIPAGVFLTMYGTRLLVGGGDDDSNIVYVSDIAAPEQISSTSGFLTIDPSEVGGVKGGIEFTHNFYLAKGTHTYVTVDNGSTPDTWRVDTIDSGIGTSSPFGFSTVYDNPAANMDLFFVASLNGLMVFNGVYVKPELSYKVDEIWKRINKAVFNLVQVVNDVQNRQIYVSVPLDGVTVISHLLVGDYTQGLNFEDIRWSLYSFPWSIASISVSANSVTGLAALKVSGLSNIYSLLATQLTDDGTSINSYVRFYPAFVRSGWINHFWKFEFATWGSGTLNVTMQGKAGVVTGTAPSLTLADPQGFEQETRVSFKNERCAVKIGCNNGTDWFKLQQAIISAKPLWANRPQ